MSDKYNLMIGGEIGCNGTPFSQQAIVNHLNNWHDLGKQLIKHKADVQREKLELLDEVESKQALQQRMIIDALNSMGYTEFTKRLEGAFKANLDVINNVKQRIKDGE